jgi:hypothetical protein
MASSSGPDTVSLVEPVLLYVDRATIITDGGEGKRSAVYRARWRGRDYAGAEALWGKTLARYEPKRALPSNARAWIEIWDKVILYDEEGGIAHIVGEEP